MQKLPVNRATGLFPSRRFLVYQLGSEAREGRDGRRVEVKNENSFLYDLLGLGWKSGTKTSSILGLRGLRNCRGGDGKESVRLLVATAQSRSTVLNDYDDCQSQTNQVKALAKLFLRHWRAGLRYSLASWACDESLDGPDSWSNRVLEQPWLRFSCKML